MNSSAIMDCGKHFLADLATFAREDLKAYL